ncbi:hypothetical protein SDC9_141113 [bioreactor metagenome]|uniref:Uncharacterized protein n=1 Tax=bioreactor metagenome TaxID=1076179 RepID=A0A645DXC4_9ZZZZ
MDALVCDHFFYLARKIKGERSLQLHFHTQRGYLIIDLQSQIHSADRADSGIVFHFGGVGDLPPVEVPLEHHHIEAVTLCIECRGETCGPRADNEYIQQNSFLLWLSFFP